MIKDYPGSSHNVKFDFYRSNDIYGDIAWVLYDHETEYYIRRVTPYRVVKAKDLDKHINSLVPNDLDERYVKDFRRAVRENWYYLFSIHNSGPSDYEAQIPGLFVKVKNPVSGETQAIRDIIINLNDYSGWSREAIADWLETLDENPIITPREDDIE